MNINWPMVRSMPIQLWFNGFGRRKWQRDRQSRHLEQFAADIDAAKETVQAFGIDPVYHNPGMYLPHHVTPLQDAVKTLTKAGYLMTDKFGRVVGMDDRYLGEVKPNPVRKSDIEAQFRRNRFQVIYGTFGESADPVDAQQSSSGQ
ncbi:hypothetical protein [Marinobacter salarius]|uniref:Uncharacterized protein n=1 Tax=Marinobacter salarius TaxID=1420917 RepID=A0A1W6KFM1_9GAMM|nr:hypothetical protein [Marinobacter salarius]ARM86193.1 hypothetical protein MARSALSMR5_04173 [Marinobacter salarius]